MNNVFSNMEILTEKNGDIPLSEYIMQHSFLRFEMHSNTKIKMRDIHDGGIGMRASTDPQRQQGGSLR